MTEENDDLDDEGKRKKLEDISESRLSVHGCTHTHKHTHTGRHTHPGSSLIALSVGHFACVFLSFTGFLLTPPNPILHPSWMHFLLYHIDILIGKITLCVCVWVCVCVCVCFRSIVLAIVININIKGTSNVLNPSEIQKITQLRMKGFKVMQ